MGHEAQATAPKGHGDALPFVPSRVAYKPLYFSSLQKHHQKEHHTMTPQLDTRSTTASAWAYRSSRLLVRLCSSPPSCASHTSHRATRQGADLIDFFRKGLMNGFSNNRREGSCNLTRGRALRSLNRPHGLESRTRYVELDTQSQSHGPAATSMHP